MDQFPSAILLARLEDVKINNNVLYRLVRPTETGTQVESVDKMVNVVPFRRIYRFDRKDDLHDFKVELLKRPIVLQPIVHLGRGLGSGSMACGMCYKDDKWVLLVNQTHPKVLSRLQIGLDAAKNAIARGQSFEIRFAFTKLIEKMYRSTLSKKEQEAAASKLDLFKSYFRYAEWEYGDLIIRYHGYAAIFGRGGGLRDMATMNLTFDFEDLTHDEIGWKGLGAEYFPKPHLAPVTEDEIREVLPAWTVNGVSPLENIGEHIPAENYSYAQAGRLYESFRKKKRWQRQEQENSLSERLPIREGASYNDVNLEVVEEVHDYERLPSSGYTAYQEDAPVQNVSYDNYGDDRVKPRQWQESYDDNEHGDDGYHDARKAEPGQGSVARKVDGYGHMYPDVKIRIAETAKSKIQPYENTSRFPVSSGIAPSSSRPLDYTDAGITSQFTRRHLQGSDRSSHSETGSSGATDSGVYSDSDGYSKESVSDRLHTRSLQNQISKQLYAMDNMGFHSDEDEVRAAMQKHKEMVAKMMAGTQLDHSDLSEQRHDYLHSNEQGYYSHRLDRNDNNSLCVKDAIPCPVSQYRHHSSKSSYPAEIGEYKTHGNRHEKLGSHKTRAQTGSQVLVEESFI